MPAIKFNLTIKCSLCLADLTTVPKGEGFLVSPCRTCALLAKEEAWDAGFDAGFDVGRSKAVDPNARLS